MELAAFHQDTGPLRGSVNDRTDGAPLPGAAVMLKGTSTGTVTDSEGFFALDLPPGQHTLEVSFIGYATAEVQATVPATVPLEIELSPSGLELGAVEVVSTGYQQLPRERATGSFVQIDRELADRRVGTNILDRLEDVVPGLVFNRTGPNTDRISIRGRSTIHANAGPLIVVDNFPYEGPLENINPNDVESMTVLRDAAAASIWGARAGNGVIVITTKKGMDAAAPRIAFNTNLTLEQRPDPFYRPIMSTGDYIDMETKLFGEGYYTAAEASPNRTPLTPVVETLIALRDGEIDGATAEQRINSFRQSDVRRDYRDHLYRPAVRQQYAVNVSGGNDTQRYFLSAGWDGNRENLVGNSFRRMTLRAGHDLSLLSDRLTISASLNHSMTAADRDNPGTASLRLGSSPELYPYARLADDAGQPLSITFDYRDSFKREAEAMGLLPWQYSPLEEIGLTDNRSRASDLRAGASLGYTLLPGLKAQLLYQYWSNSSSSQNIALEDSYAARNLVNRYTQIDPATSLFSYPVPQGGLLDYSDGEGESNDLRALLSYEGNIGKDNLLSAIAGYELRAHRTGSRGNRLYGYDASTGSSLQVDYANMYPQFTNPGQRLLIPYRGAVSGSADNFISYFANASYRLSQRYTFSGSARKDASNLFGVEANRKAVPLWSAGFAWELSNEPFYNSGIIPYLRLRASYGENGNVDKRVSALTTARIFGPSRLSGLRSATLTNTPNADLRWERIRIWNLAADFELFGDALSGNLEVYSKTGTDLIGDINFPPSSGLTSFRGNFASTATTGLDLQLTSKNLRGKFEWNTVLLLSRWKEKVTEYEIENSALNYLGQATGADPSASVMPLEGRPIYAVYSLPWGGLDPETGDPLGLLDGAPSTDYAAIIGTATPQGLVYHGPSRPTAFGAIRNELAYGGFSLSFNISYRLGYYYRRPSVRYDLVLTGQMAHGDYAERWQQPGDEAHTDVPSIPASRNAHRDNYYLYSSALVEKGDHIRLQDLRIAYDRAYRADAAMPFRSLGIYVYADNLGILWKASDDPLDPDFREMKPLTSFSVGLKAEF